MLWNFLKVSLRKLVRQWPFTLMSLSGLAIGISCFYLVLLYVHFESHYDQSFQKASRIFRVEQSLDSKNWAATPRGVGPYLAGNYPEVVQMARLQPIDGAPWVKRGKDIFKEDRVYYADSTLFDVFDFEWIKKDRAFPLSAPFSVVLTESMAQKYFGTEDPIGKFLQFAFDGNQSREVVGIIRDLPQQSHLSIDFLCSIYSYSQRYNTRWGNFNTYTYVVSHGGSFGESLGNSLSQVYDEQYQVAPGTYAVRFTPIQDIHLHSHSEKEMSVNNRSSYLHILLLTGFFVWIISLINFINLHIIRYIKRDQEFQIRMILGANKRGVSFQLFIESTLIIGIAATLAVSIIQIALDYISEFTGLRLDFQYAAHPELLGYFLAILMVSIVASVFYPFAHFFKRSLKVILKNRQGSLSAKREAVHLRKGLIIGQFVFANFLLLSSIVIYKQLDFLLTKDLGFDHKNTIAIPLDFERKAKYPSLKSSLEDLSHIQGVSTAHSVPGNRIPIEEFNLSGERESHFFRVLYTGWDFSQTLNLDLLEGRAFKPSDVEAETATWMLNQKAADLLFPNQQRVVGKNLKLEKYQMEGSIIGVVEDFHFESLHSEIVPLVFSVTDKNRLFNYAIVRTASASRFTHQLFDEIHTADRELFAHLPPLEPIWMNQLIEDLYTSEKNLQQLVSTFCLISLLLSMLGIVAFISFLLLQRTKEIAVRKILGSSQKQVALLFGRELLMLVGVTFLLSIPLSTFVLSKWLEAFSYKVKMEWPLFFLSGFILLVLTFASVAFSLFKAMKVNPAQQLSIE